MLDEDPTGDGGAAEELLRRALLDDSSAVAVSLRVHGLPLSEAVTVIFHARRDLGTLQTYVANGSRGAGASVAANELLRVPCDLDLADAEDRDQAERLYVEQASVLRDALVGADGGLDGWRGGRLSRRVGGAAPRGDRSAGGGGSLGRALGAASGAPAAAHRADRAEHAA